MRNRESVIGLCPAQQNVEFVDCNLLSAKIATILSGLTCCVTVQVVSPFCLLLNLRDCKQHMLIALMVLGTELKPLTCCDKQFGDFEFRIRCCCDGTSSCKQV